MKKKLSLLLIGLIWLGNVHAQITSFSFSIKALSANEVGVYVKPIGSGNTRWTTVAAVIGMPSACFPNYKQTWHTSPWLDSVFGPQYQGAVNDTGYSVTPSGYRYHVYTLFSQPPIYFAYLTSGTEYLLGTVTFSQPIMPVAGSCPVVLMDFADQGSGGNAGNTYVVDASLVNSYDFEHSFYSPTMLNASFYSDSGGYQNSTSLATTVGNTDAWLVTLQNAPVVLPVKLLSFNANAAADCQAHLSWEVTNIKDFSHFEPEYSKDGRTFTKIGSIKNDIGNTNTTVSYQFSYLQPDDKGYYRLKMVDFDGSTQYSYVLTVLKQCNTQTEITVSPNPTAGEVTVRGVSAGATISLYNATGQLLQEFKAQDQTQKLNIAGYAAGLYLISVRDTGAHSQHFRIVKQ